MSFCGSNLSTQETTIKKNRQLKKGDMKVCQTQDGQKRRCVGGYTSKHACVSSNLYSHEGWECWELWVAVSRKRNTTTKYSAAVC